MSAESRIRRTLSTTTEVDRLLRRIRCQIDFGRAIDDGSFASTLAQAETSVFGKDFASVADLREAVSKAEALLAPVATEAKTFTIHCVGHGHIDMNWMWSWPETCATTHDTFASVLSLMEQYPDLTYSQSQASVYALVEKYHPEMFEQIRRRVKEGRWEVAAVHWVEGDKNLASGEALAHHLLYTRRYFEEKFGLKPEDCQLDWEPDTFGHCNTLPGILRQGGVKYYYCCRPGGGQEHLRVGEERPPVFWWQSPDGSRVLVNKETTWYNSYVEIGDNFALPAAAFWKKTGLKDWLNVYGIGNHGGGPTRDEVEYFIETRDWPCWPQVVFGTAQGWFRKVEPLCGDMPVIDHELNYEFTGCYTSQSAIKKANRYGENYCVEAETLQAIADQRRDAPDIHGRDARAAAWINVLFNQFHDILPGSGVAATRNHALGLFQETGAITGAIKRNALQAIAKDLNTVSLLPDTPDASDERSKLVNTPFEAGSGQGAGESGFSRASGGGRRFRPVMIYNPCAWTRSEMVEINLYDLPEDIEEENIVALDENGVAHPTLPITAIAGGNHDWGHRRNTVLFYAKDIPALGYRTFLFCEGKVTDQAPGVISTSETEFETPAMNVRLDKYYSGIRECRLNTLSEPLATESDLGDGIGRWMSVREWPTGMSAWLLGGNDGRVTEKAVSQDPLLTSRFNVIGPRRNEATDLRSGSNFAIVAMNEMKNPGTASTVKLRTVLSGFKPRVDFYAEVDWREIGNQEAGVPGLRIDSGFSLVYQAPEGLFETPFGTVLRPIGAGNEMPSLRFAHFQDETEEGQPIGVTLLQDSKYGHSISNWTVSLRVLRSTYEPDHAPEVGKSTMRYALVFHDSEPTKAELVRLGAAFNHPFIVVPTLLQEGSQPTKRSFAEVETESVVLSTMKPAEERNGLILRLVNYADEEVEAVVRLDPNLIENYKEAKTVDLMERPSEGQAELREGRLYVKIKANSFITVLAR
ncbi:MAG TPA: glycoside hydrolase family 38 C-terminal domain-containing protein [Fimbriimonadaceae bacterium]|nr:glycoside hydrolase family 38 C-terminal domain-containing protein [Fimbriimonadaceae bacterium]